MVSLRVFASSLRSKRSRRVSENDLGSWFLVLGSWPFKTLYYQGNKT
jgi:hypothetical protein